MFPAEGLSKIIYLKYYYGNKAIELVGKVVRAQRVRLFAVTELELSVRVEDEQEGVDSNGRLKI